jgi:hypothetical protein
MRSVSFESRNLNNTTSQGPIVLADFGGAGWSDSTHTGLIQPIRTRVSEDILSTLLESIMVLVVLPQKVVMEPWGTASSIM